MKGGSKYDDSEGPFLVSILPPKPTEELTVQTQDAVQQEGEVAVPVNQQVAPIQMANQPVDVGNEIAAQTGGDIANTTPNDPASSSRKIGEVFYEGGELLSGTR